MIRIVKLSTLPIQIFQVIETQCTNILFVVLFCGIIFIERAQIIVAQSEYRTKNIIDKTSDIINRTLHLKYNSKVRMWHEDEELF
jgi:hypothetical protein